MAKDPKITAVSNFFQEIEKVVNDDNKAEINGRTYQLSKMTHKMRLPFLQYYQDMQPNPVTGIVTKKMDYEEVENMLSGIVLFEGATLKNLPNHFDTYPQDYMPYINTMLMVVVYPFLGEQLQLLKGL